MKTLRDMKPGDKVAMHDVNRRGDWFVKVAKVGRKLIHVEADGRLSSFRIDSGVENDEYGHRSIRTLDEFQRDLCVDTARERLVAFGLRPERIHPDRIVAADAALAGVEGYPLRKDGAP